MKFLYLLFFNPLFLFSQSLSALVDDLNKVHLETKNQSCETGQILTNRGMNLFMGDRVGYYLADHENLTFCKNNITVNTTNGMFSMSHSLFEPKGADLPVKSYNVIGLKANIFNAYQSATNQQAFNNELGFTYKHFWLSKPKVVLNNCNEKKASDAFREIILNKIVTEITDESSDFENSLIKIQNTSDSVKNDLKKPFHETIKEKYSRKFADLQFRNLFETMRFKKISMNWTNLSVYLPIIRQRFAVAGNLTEDFNTQKSYPAEIAVNHTRFLETQNATKIYFNIRASILANNSINSKILNWISMDSYKNLGGKNSDYFAEKQIERATIGRFKNFITPSLTAQITYFPPENHFGISATVEQNFGKFKALNGRIGIPIVLIDKQSAPQTNLEIQINYFDITNTLNSSRSFKDRTSIGLVWGQPIGRNVY